RRVVVAEVALKGRHRRRIGHAISGSVGIRRSTVSTAAEENGDYAGRLQARGMAQEVFGSVVLGMTAALVHRVEVLVADWHLPFDKGASGLGTKLGHPRQPLLEIRQARVSTVPPAPVDAGVVVRDVVENEVECAGMSVGRHSGRTEESRYLVG